MTSPHADYSTFSADPRYCSYFETPDYDFTHRCDRCERHPHEFSHLPADEGIFLVQFSSDIVPIDRNPFMYLCNECMPPYVRDIAIRGSPDDTDTESEWETETTDEDPSSTENEETTNEHSDDPE